MKGQTLIEILVAAAVIGVVATALTGVVITGMNSAQQAKNRNLATQYAQEGMEIIRQMRDNNYVDFRNAVSGTYCLTNPTDFASLPPACQATKNIASFFSRNVTITSPTNCGGGANVQDMTAVTVAVAWQDGKCPAANTFCQQVRLDTCLSTVSAPPL